MENKDQSFGKENDFLSVFVVLEVLGTGINQSINQLVSKMLIKSPNM